MSKAMAMLSHTSIELVYRGSQAEGYSTFVIKQHLSTCLIDIVMSFLSRLESFLRINYFIYTYIC
jgi:hypothetical protein